MEWLFICVLSFLVIAQLIWLRQTNARLEKTRKFIGEINSTLRDLQIRVNLHTGRALNDLALEIQDLKYELSRISHSNKSTKAMQKEIENMFASMTKYQEMISNDIRGLSDRVEEFDTLLTLDDHRKILAFPIKNGGAKHERG